MLATKVPNPRGRKERLREVEAAAKGKKQTIQVRETFPVLLGRFLPPRLLGNCSLSLPLLLLNQREELGYISFPIRLFPSTVFLRNPFAISSILKIFWL